MAVLVWTMFNLLSFSGWLIPDQSVQVCQFQINNSVWCLIPMPGELCLWKLLWLDGIRRTYFLVLDTDSAGALGGDRSRACKTTPGRRTAFRQCRSAQKGTLKRKEPQWPISPNCSNLDICWSKWFPLGGMIWPWRDWNGTAMNNINIYIYIT